MNKIRREIPYFEAVQAFVNTLLLKPGQFKRAVNVTNDPVGVLTVRPGYEEINGSPLTTYPIKALHNAQQEGTSRLLTNYDWLNPTNNAIYNRLDFIENGIATQVTIEELIGSSSLDYDFCDFFNYTIGVRRWDNGTDASTFSIKGSTLSLTDMVKNAPGGKYILPFQGKVYVLDCIIDGVNHPNSAFYSSGLMGRAIPITYINGDQTGTLVALTVDSTKYLKVGDTIDVYQPYTNTVRSGGTAVAITAITSDTTLTISSRTLTFTDGDFIFFGGTKGTDKIYWDTSSQVPNELIISGPGEKITGGNTNKARMIITKHESSHKWDGNALTEVSHTVGCYSHKSLVELNGMTYGFHNNKNGFWEYNNTGEPVYMSESVRPYWEAIPDADQDKVCHYIDHKGRIGWMVGTVTVDGKTIPNCELVFNPKLDMWYVYSKSDHGVSYTQFKSIGGANYYYMGTDNGKSLRQESGYNDDGKSIGFEAESGWDGFDYPEIAKEIKEIHIFAKNTGFSLSYAFDFSDEYIPLGDVQERYTILRLPEGKRIGRLFSWKVSGSSKTSKPSIERIIIKGNYLNQEKDEIK